MAAVKVGGRKKSVYSIPVDGTAYNEYQQRRQFFIVNEIEERIREAINKDIIGRGHNSDAVLDPRFVNAVVAEHEDRSITLKSVRKLQNQSQENPSTTHTGINDKDLVCSNVFQRKWLVLLAGFVSLMISPGFPFNMSALYVEFSSEFMRSKAETSLVQSVCTGLFFIGGVFSGGIISRFGTRVCGMVGGFLSAVGVFLSYFATNIPFLIVTLGILGGVGFSITYICASTSVSNYFFGQERILAFAFISFGSGVGSMLFPLIIQSLTEEFGWRGCLMIISGIILNISLCNAIGKQPSEKKGPIAPRSINRENNPRFSTIKTTSNKNKDLPAIIDDMKTCLRKKNFMAYTFGLAIALAVFNSLLIFYIDYFEFSGFTRTTGVWIYFGMTTCNTVFRLIPGFLTRISKLPKTAIPGIFIGVGAIAIFLLPTVSTLEQTVVIVCIFGVGLGGTVTTISITTLDLVGVDAYSTGLGINLTIIGLFNVGAGPFFGFVRDITRSYDLTFYIGAGCSFFASCILICITFLCKVKTADAQDIEIVVQKRRESRRGSILPWRGKADFTVL